MHEVCAHIHDMILKCTIIKNNCIPNATFPFSYIKFFYTHIPRKSSLLQECQQSFSNHSKHIVSSMLIASLSSSSFVGLRMTKDSSIQDFPGVDCRPGSMLQIHPIEEACSYTWVLFMYRAGLSQPFPLLQKEMF